MASSSDHAAYYIPHSGWYPVWLAAGIFFLLAGLGVWLNDLKAGAEPSMTMFYIGAVIVALVHAHALEILVGERRHARAPG